MFESTSPQRLQYIYAINILGKALHLSNKQPEAQSIWAHALRIPGDMDLHMQIRTCISGT